MRCAACGRTGIRWMGPYSNPTHTECPDCGGRNCQEVEAPAEECSLCGCLIGESAEDHEDGPICVECADQLDRAGLA